MVDYGALAGRAHGGRPTVPLHLATDEREKTEAAMRPAKAEQRVVRRSQAVLMMADAVPAGDIARMLGVHPRTVEDAVAARVESEACRKPSDVGLPVTHFECWSSILARHVLARGSFVSTDDLAAKIDAYVAWYLATDRPFRWSYRRLRDGGGRHCDL